MTLYDTTTKEFAALPYEVRMHREYINNLWSYMSEDAKYEVNQIAELIRTIADDCYKEGYSQGLKDGGKNGRF